MYGVGFKFFRRQSPRRILELLKQPLTLKKHGGLTQRDLYVICAAFPSTSSQCHHGAKGSEITRQEVA